MTKNANKKKIEETLQDIPEYENLTDADKMVLVVAIKNFLSQHMTKKEEIQV